MRASIQKELDMYLQPADHVPSSSFLQENSLKHSTTRGDYARRLQLRRSMPYSDESEVSDDDQAGRMFSESTGNHTLFLATPRGKGQRQARHPRPPLSRFTKEHLDISRIARVEDAADEEAPPKRAPPKRTPPKRAPSPQSSRHSSAETKVNSDEGTPHVPENVRWVEQQLRALTSYIHDMEQKLAQVGSGAAADTLGERVARLEGALRAQEDELKQLSHTFYEHEAQCTPGRLESAVHQLAARLDRMEPRSPRVEHQAPRPAPTETVDVDASIARLYDELARISHALGQMQSAHAPRGTRPAAPLTPPYEKEHSMYAPRVPSNDPIPRAPADDLAPAHERYEQICRMVADLMGLAPGAEPSFRRTRRDRTRAGIKQREAAEVSAEMLLRRLNEVPEPRLSSAELSVLEQVFDQHCRDFVRQRQIYSEMADDLKRLEPGMDRKMRRALTQSVHNSIDALEAEATRLNELHAHLARHGRTARYDVHGS